MKIHFMYRVLAVCAAAALAGCSSVVAVKDVTADQEGYLQQKFAPAAVDAAVLAKLPTAAAGSFTRMTMTRQVTSEGTDGKKETGTAVTTYRNGGNGIVYYKTEHAANGIPFGLGYTASYAGLLALRTQLVPLRLRNTTAIYEIKEIGSITPLPAEVGKTFAVRFKTGTTMQVTNYQDTERACTAARRFPAAELNGKLAGNALEFNCEERTNNTVQNRSTWALLEQYGFAVQTSGTSSTSKSTYLITGVSGG